MLIVYVVDFERTQGAATERGLMINEDQTILGADGNPVCDAVWSYRNRPELGCFVVPPLPPERREV